MNLASLTKAFLGLTVLGAGLLTPGVAAADLLGSVSAGVLVGNGFKDGLNLGLGVRAGYTFPFKLYVGGTFVYHLGESETIAGEDFSTNLYYYGAEGGYDFDLGPAVLRPYLGLGPATASLDAPAICAGAFCTPAVSDNETKFGFWPGATVFVPLAGFFVGADARYLIVDEFNAFSAFVTAGLKF